MEYSINSRPLLEHSDEQTDSDPELNRNNQLVDGGGGGGGDGDGLDDDDMVEDNKSLIRRSQSLPVDKFNYNYIIFYLLGITSMVPWNFCLTAEDYWMYKFRNTTANSTNVPLTPLQAGFTSDLSVASSVPSTIFLVLNAFFSHKIPLAIRMVGSFIVILVLFIVMTSFVEVNTDDWQQGFLILSLSIVVVMNSFAAILSGGLFGIAGLFPSEYITALVSGQALGGIFSAVAEIVSLTFGYSPKTTAFVFFNVGNLTLVLAIVCYVIMSKTIFFKYFTVEKLKMQKKLLSNSSSSASYTESESVQTNGTSRPNFMHVLNKIWLYGFSEWFVFVTTLSVYPSVTVLVNSQNKGNGHAWNDIYFMTVTNYLIFNSGDYLGRILAGIIEWPKNRPRLIAALTIMRVVFVPLFLLCNEMPRRTLPVWIHSDIIFIAMMVVFSFTNGYIANICLISAPKVVQDYEKEMASSLMAAFLGIGLAFGSSFSLVFVEII